MRALDLERHGGVDAAEIDQPWRDATDGWNGVLRRAAFWAHVRHRLGELDDRRFDESVVDALRDELPRTLVAPIVALAVESDNPQRLTERARRWGVDARVLDDLVLARVEPTMSRIQDTLDRARREREAGAAPREAVEQVKAVVPDLRRLRLLLPNERRIRMLRERAALLLNNAGVAALSQDGPASEVRGWFTLAIELTDDGQLRRTAEANRARLDARAEMERDLALLGVTPDNAQRRVVELINQGRLSEARALLTLLRKHADAAERAQIDQLLAVLNDPMLPHRGTVRASLGPPPVPPHPVSPPRRTARPTPSPLRSTRPAKRSSPPARGRGPEPLTWGGVAGVAGVLAVVPGLVWWIFGMVAGAVLGAIWGLLVVLIAIGSWQQRRDRW